ncbi:MAG: hypothetical protein K9W43_03325 [Candidatus Thorarchaeota archaeon]|nr:hypothetical protein [Candidatus Thorarchaeota archaeon]
MKLDEGSFMVLKAAPGAYSCSSLPLPQSWDPVKRPHVALLIPTGNELFRVMLSTPQNNNDHLEISNLSKIDVGSIIEIRYGEVEYKYFRKDSTGWTNVGASDDPFFVEVFTSGLTPLYLIALETPIRSLMNE